MAIDFPASPSVGQQYTFAGTTYVFSAEGVWVSQAVVSTPAWSTGDVKVTFRTSDAGWVWMNDGSIGNATSGATARANADTAPLFTLLYDGIPSLILQNSAGATVARGANAAADFAADRRLVLPATLGRALASSGAGAGLTARLLGATAGEEAHALSVAEMPSHGHGVNDPGHGHGVAASFYFINSDGGVSQAGPGAGVSFYNTTTVTTGTAAAGTGISIQANGGNSAHNIMQPTTFLNVLIKL